MSARTLIGAGFFIALTLGAGPAYAQASDAAVDAEDRTGAARDLGIRPDAETDASTIGIIVTNPNAKRPERGVVRVTGEASADAEVSRPAPRAETDARVEAEGEVEPD
jgi:hypothetical protein